MEFIFDNSSIVELIINCKLHDCIEQFSKDNILMIPTRVFEEFQDKNPETSDIECLKTCFTIVEVDEDSVIESFFDHDPTRGEYWVIAHADKNPGCCAVIDEGYGRTIAEFLGLEITGTIGVLRMMRDTGILSRDLLETTKNKILDGTFHLNREMKRELKSL